MSLLSNATSEQSDLNESRDEIIDYEPLFLQVLITIRHGRETMITSPISQLPTCLIDLFKSASASASGDTDQLNDAIDMSKFSVSLDLLTFSIRQDQPLPLGARSKIQNPDRMRSVSLCSNLSFSDPHTYESSGAGS